MEGPFIQMEKRGAHNSENLVPGFKSAATAFKEFLQVYGLNEEGEITLCRQAFNAILWVTILDDKTQVSGI